ncbi:MAG TPA: carbon starvation protein A, partial [Bacteroidales bacterium]|nr:carbon starvation protein A [Bacteroidales bacterium]
TLAAITLWVITVALANYNRFFWITLIPAIFMTMVVITYILVAPEGFQLPLASGVWIAAIVSVLASGWFFYKKKPV